MPEGPTPGAPVGDRMVGSYKTTLVWPRALREVARPSAEDMTDRIGKKLGIDGLREDTRKWRLAQVIILIVAGDRDHRNWASTRPLT